MFVPVDENGGDGGFAGAAFVALGEYDMFVHNLLIFLG
jgi:hypothetical protein